MKIYIVCSLDMWGHVPADCSASYGCSCMVDCADCGGEGNGCETCPDSGGKVHNDDRCDCSEECNDQFRAGTIEIADDANDAAILDALRAGDFLSEEGRVKCRIDDYGDGSTLDVNDDAGRGIFHLIEENGS